jgi:hypothetical protein
MIETSEEVMLSKATAPVAPCLMRSSITHLAGRSLQAQASNIDVCSIEKETESDK